MVFETHHLVFGVDVLGNWLDGISTGSGNVLAGVKALGVCTASPNISTSILLSEALTWHRLT